MHLTQLTLVIIRTKLFFSGQVSSWDKFTNWKINKEGILSGLRHKNKQLSVSFNFKVSGWTCQAHCNSFPAARLFWFWNLWSLFLQVLKYLYNQHFQGSTPCYVQNPPLSPVHRVSIIRNIQNHRLTKFLWFYCQY